MAERARLRQVVVEIPLPGTLAVSIERGGWEAQFRGRVVDCELFLRDTGTGTGNTDLDVNKGGASVFTGGVLRIASAATTKRTRKKPNVGVSGHPNGVPFDPGDYFSADVDAIPGTTASIDGVVHLHIVATDV